MIKNMKIMVVVLCFFVVLSLPTRKTNAQIIKNMYSEEENIDTAKTLFTQDILLSPIEKEILKKGRISKGKRITGGIVGSIVGFGTGHAIVGEWKDTGVLFFVTETVVLLIPSIFVLTKKVRHFVFDGSVTYDDSIERYIYIGIRLFEIYDLWRGPIIHNKHYDDIQKKISKNNLSISVIPLKTSDNYTLGIGLSVGF